MVARLNQLGPERRFERDYDIIRTTADRIAARSSIMMIDTSAIVAVLFGEPEAESTRQTIARDPVRIMSALTWLELTLAVESRRGLAAVAELEVMISPELIVSKLM